MASSNAAAGSRAERRRVIATRNAIKLAANLADTAGNGKEALILNISSAGVLLQTARDLALGEVVRIDLAAAGRHTATVMWTIDGMVGCQFLNPLPKSSLSAALLQSEALPTPSGDPTVAQPANSRAASENRRFGLSIAMARKAKGMTQGELGQAIGVSTTTICKWEQGHVSPRAKALVRLESCVGRLDLHSTSPSEPAILANNESATVSSNILHECKLKIAMVLGVRPEAISWQLQVTV